MSLRYTTAEWRQILELLESGTYKTEVYQMGAGGKRLAEIRAQLEGRADSAVVEYGRIYGRDASSISRALVRRGFTESRERDQLRELEAVASAARHLINRAEDAHLALRNRAVRIDREGDASGDAEAIRAQVLPAVDHLKELAEDVAEQGRVVHVIAAEVGL